MNSQLMIEAYQAAAQVLRERSKETFQKEYATQLNWVADKLEAVTVSASEIILAAKRDMALDQPVSSATIQPGQEAGR